MTATISESYVSRPFNVGIKSSSRELVYDIVGTHDESAVQTLILSTAPAVYNGLILDSVEAEPIYTNSTNSTGLWKGYARYLVPEIEYTFDTGGGTQTITQSYETMASHVLGGGLAPNFDGAIGVSEDRVEGVSVTIPKFDFTETHIWDASNVTSTYTTALQNLTGCWNVATWRQYAAGTVLFLGATGSNRGSGQWSITYRFSFSPNVTGLMIGGIGPISKQGWDYLWVRYADFEDASAYSLVKRPIAVYVERVLLPGDFTTLLIS